MNKRILALILALTMLLFVGCQPAGGTPENGENNEMNNEENSGKQSRGDGFVLKAVVKELNADHESYIEVEVIESDYAFGTYWVRLADGIEIVKQDGSIGALTDIKAGQTVLITYSGQTMLSMPPQIVTWKIKIQ